MARSHRSRSRRPRKRGGRASPKQPPGWCTLLCWLIPFAALAALADWAVVVDVLRHYRAFRHVSFSTVGLVVAISLTGMTISIPFVWLQVRRKARRSQ